MKESDALRDIILREAVKGLRYNPMERKLSYDLRLRDFECKKIIQIAQTHFGFTAQAEIRATIDKVLSQFSLTEKGIVKMCVDSRRFPIGSVVTVNAPHGRDLSLVYMGANSYRLLHHDLGGLCRGDVLIPLLGHFIVSQRCLLRVMREGECYPSANKVYAIDPVISLKVVENVRSAIVLPAITSLAPRATAAQVYASFGRPDLKAFSSEGLVSAVSSTSLFEINLVKMTYTLSPHFRPMDVEPALRDLTLKELRRMCSIPAEADNLLRLRPAEPGMLQSVPDARTGSYYLSVSQPAKIATR